MGDAGNSAFFPLDESRKGSEESRRWNVHFLLLCHGCNVGRLGPGWPGTFSSSLFSGCQRQKMSKMDLPSGSRHKAQTIGVTHRVVVQELDVGRGSLAVRSISDVGRSHCFLVVRQGMPVL